MVDGSGAGSAVTLLSSSHWCRLRSRPSCSCRMRCNARRSCFTRAIAPRTAREAPRTTRETCSPRVLVAREIVVARQGGETVVARHGGEDVARSMLGEGGCTGGRSARCSAPPPAQEVTTRRSLTNWLVLVFLPGAGTECELILSNVRMDSQPDSCYCRERRPGTGDIHSVGQTRG